jgi:RNA polymerase primary sigma factor
MNHTINGRSDRSEVSSVILRGLSPEERALYQRIPQRVDYMDNPLFRSPGAEDRLFGPEAGKIRAPGWIDFLDEEEALENGRLHKPRPSLSTAEEQELFLRYNYARYRLHKLLEAQKQRRSLGRARQMCLWMRRAMEARAVISGANMPLVLAMAKRTRIPHVEFADLVSEGNMALLRSMEKFDVSRGFKFSTYACRCILKAFNRMATKTGRYHQRFPTEYDPDMERSDDDVTRHERRREDSIECLREILSENRANLTEVERTVILERFALGSGDKGRTLADVGRLVGLTNERVRQIQILAMRKIRNAMNELCLVA